LGLLRILLRLRGVLVFHHLFEARPFVIDRLGNGPLAREIEKQSAAGE
jgi:hypothetical protein